MEKYFEGTIYEGSDEAELFYRINKIFRVVNSNLFFNELHKDELSKKYKENTCNSIFHLIAVCEALLANYPEDMVTECKEKTADDVSFSVGSISDFVELLTKISEGRD